MISLSPPPYVPSICLNMSVTHPFSVFARLPFVCLCVYLAFLGGLFESSHSTCMHTNTQTHLYETFVYSTTLVFSFSVAVLLLTHTHTHVTCSHQKQADGPSARQAADPCPHSPNEHPLALGGQTQNQTPNIANTTAPTATHYQPPACCDIPCALIVQHSYEPTNPSELTPKMRMSTFTTSPPTPRLYIQ